MPERQFDSGNVRCAGEVGERSPGFGSIGMVFQELVRKYQGSYTSTVLYPSLPLDMGLTTFEAVDEYSVEKNVWGQWPFSIQNQKMGEKRR